MKTTKKDECSYSFSNAIRTPTMVREAGLELVYKRFLRIQKVKYIAFSTLAGFCISFSDF